MKFATHLLLFNQDKWIIKNINMIGPYVDKIYVSWSKIPWNYNPNARQKFENKSNPDILKQSKFFNKIKLIKGVWSFDEDQRNSCLNAAKKDDIDYLFIIDADEFYTDNHINEMIKAVKKEPNFDYYITPWLTFWKDFNHLIITDKNEFICGYPEVILNINSGHRFTRCRKPSGNKIKRLNSLCFHASYVLSDDECWSKINTWGHAHQFNRQKWFNEKWKNWNENTLNLHPISPAAWLKASVLPKEIKLPNILK